MTAGAARNAGIAGSGCTTSCRVSLRAATGGRMAGNPRRSNGHRRDQLRRRVLAEEDVCWICNQPVDKTLKTPHPYSPEVDEVHAVSLGGSPYDRDNCRLSHRICNVRRGNGTKARTTALTTARTWTPGG